MDLRRYLDMLRRQKWLIVESVLVVAVLAGVLASLRTPTYRATASVLLKPNDPAETLNPGLNVSYYTDPTRYNAAQIAIIESEAVASIAAKSIPGSSGGALLGEIGASQSATDDIIYVSAVDTDPIRARDVANAFANAYIANRRAYDIGSLQVASDKLSSELSSLTNQIDNLDRQIGNAPTVPATGTSSDTSPATAPSATSPATAPAATSPATAPTATNPATPPSNQIDLEAARYAATTQYETDYQQEQQIQLDISLKRGDAEVVTLASTPFHPLGKSTKRYVAYGIAVGFLLGCGFGLVREQLDDRIHTRDEAEALVNLPVLAELPFDDASADSGTYLAANEAPLGTFAEATRSLRTSLQFLSVDEPLNRILVTSAGPKDGKSTVAANLATVYAQAGYLTVLVSADLRRPRAEQILGIPTPTTGLTDLVATMSHRSRNAAEESTNGHGPEDFSTMGTSRPGLALRDPAHVRVNGSRSLEAAVGKALVETRVKNLLLLPAGAAPPNPAELLASRRTAEVLDAISVIADIVIIDSPPVLAVTDAVVLAANVDGIILVNALAGTKRGALKRMKSTLDGTHARLCGMVLNKLSDWDESSYYSYYGYSTRGPEEKTSRLPSLRSVRSKAKAQARKAEPPVTVSSDD